ncbi:CHASE domain-containing protein [Loktanella salsilacus]|jgi:signal transduction histidine kinase/sensor domain CHASE-containing protein|uniref:histidine kinase n=2 Tax=Loktanella salsilacus TaxID=195913 RepID=A0A1I4JWL9_9RHOB|nr:CHASE domain-containing protein [Loktanella salsilacus]
MMAKQMPQPHPNVSSIETELPEVGPEEMNQLNEAQTAGRRAMVVRLLESAKGVLWAKLFLIAAALVVITFPLLGLTAMNRSDAIYLASERNQLEKYLYQATNQIRLSFFEAELVAGKIEGLLTASGETPDLLIQKDVEALLASNPNVLAVALAPDLTVTQTFPLSANQGTVGLKYWEVHRQLPGVARAYRQGSPVVVGPISLVQGGIGYILRYPVFLPQDGLSAERFWGIISVVIKADGLINNNTATFDQGEELVFTLYEVRQRAMTSESEIDGHWQGSEVPISVEFPMAGAKWRASAAPIGGWPKRSPQGYVILTTSILLAMGAAASLLIVHSVSEKHAKHHALLQESISCMNEGFAAFDQNNCLVMANHKFREYYPNIVDKLVPGVPFAVLVRAGVQRSQFPEAIGNEKEWVASRISAFMNPQGSFIHQISDGRWVKVTEAKTPYGYTVGIRTDVTAEKRAMDAAEAADLEKTNFISNVSHELRTPLTVIVGRASFFQHQDKLPAAARLDNLLQGSADISDEVKNAVEAYKGYVADQGSKIVHASKHMLRLVEDLLDWTTAERGTMHIQKEIVSLADLTDAVAEELRPLAQAKDLDFRYSSNVQVNIFGDQARLRQILYNLMSNSIKFTEHGHVELGVVERPDEVVISISDTGCGIPEAYLDRIFERFQQVDASVTRQKGGFGLGLAIAKQLAELHDGELTVTSRVGIGSCFQLKLPVISEKPLHPEMA